MDHLDFIYDFPAWTLVSWVLITGLYIGDRRALKRLDAVELAVFPTRVDNPAWEYQNYHRAASELVTSAVSYPTNKVAKLAEAETYALRAMQIAVNADQRRLTAKLIEAIVAMRAELYQEEK